MDTQTQNPSISFPSVVNLNVGGQIYTTSLATVTKYSESTLGAMFRGRFPIEKDPNGNYFIDRDGALFRYILVFLRNGELHIPDNFHEFGLLLKEAEFFQIPALTDAVKQQMQSRDGQKSNKPEKTETMTMFGEGGRNGLLNSVSGRLLTLKEMFHIGDGESEIFLVSPYDSQSGQYGRTGKMTVKNKRREYITTHSVLNLAMLHDFKVTSEPGGEKINFADGYDKCWILTRPSNNGTWL